MATLILYALVGNGSQGLKQISCLHFIFSIPTNFAMKFTYFLNVQEINTSFDLNNTEYFSIYFLVNITVTLLFSNMVFIRTQHCVLIVLPHECFCDRIDLSWKVPLRQSQGVHLNVTKVTMIICLWKILRIQKLIWGWYLD